MEPDARADTDTYTQTLVPQSRPVRPEMVLPAEQNLTLITKVVFNQCPIRQFWAGFYASLRLS